MAYVQREGLGELGIATAIISAGASVIGSIFGGGGPKQTYPWHWEKVSGDPDSVALAFGTKNQFFRVWTGKISAMFTGPSFSVGGRTDRGKWRMYREGRQIYVDEWVNDEWNPVLYPGEADPNDTRTSEQALRQFTGSTAPMVTGSTVQQVQTTLQPVTATVTGSGTMPWLLVGGLVVAALVFGKRR
jgi:hypothetical protein